MLSDDEFRKLLQFFDRPWAGYKKVRKSVKKRIRRHMQNLGSTDIEKYLQILKQSPKEKSVCTGCLSVIISRFYRDRKMWEYLKVKVLPDLITHFPASINTWSAGCSNGEEPYSLAVIWDSLATDTQLYIVATDTNADCLERARRGIYGRSSLNEVPNEVLTRYFKELPGLQYEINPTLQKRICWQQHDLFGRIPEGGPFHLIFLRNNLLTYHQGMELKKIFSNIVKNLVPKGYLITGAHEQLPINDATLILNMECPCVLQRVG